MDLPRASDARVSVLFCTSSLGGGGAEMHMLRVINNLNHERFRISLALARGGGQYEAALAPDVTRHVLGGRGRIRHLLALRRLLRAERPDLVCAVMDHMNVLAILSARTLFNPPKLIACVQIPPTIEYRGKWNSRNRVLLALIRRLYPAADRVLVLSRGVEKDLRSLVQIRDDRVHVIYNAGVDATVREKAREAVTEELVPADCPLIVACGRLTEQKGFPYLLDAFARVRDSIPACLVIVGEGEDRERLEAKIRQLGLTQSVRLVGFQENPYKFMAVARVFGPVVTLGRVRKRDRRSDGMRRSGRRDRLSIRARGNHL